MIFLYECIERQTYYISVIYQLLIRYGFQFRDMTKCLITPYIRWYIIEHSDVMSSM